MELVFHGRVNPGPGACLGRTEYAAPWSHEAIGANSVATFQLLRDTPCPQTTLLGHSVSFYSRTPPPRTARQPDSVAQAADTGCLTDSCGASALTTVIHEGDENELGPSGKQMETPNGIGQGKLGKTQ